MTSESTLCVQCPQCRGTGEIPLPFHLKETLIYLREHGVRSTSQLHRALTPKAAGTSGMCNRLSALRELGLVEVAWADGKKNFWRATEGEGATP
ncbi:hypothetical protein EON83_11000 [bacterium]|nr:MAG: hypothetical protein EON83_11000 [bacterium]